VKYSAGSRLSKERQGINSYSDPEYYEKVKKGASLAMTQLLLLPDTG
jgi:hypothetical protein